MRTLNVLSNVSRLFKSCRQRSQRVRLYYARDAEVLECRVLLIATAWDAAVDGQFIEGEKWTDSSPGALDDATIAKDGTYTITFTFNHASNNLSMSNNANVTFDMQGNRQYHVGDTIRIGSDPMGNDTTQLTIANSGSVSTKDVTVDGGGTLGVFGTGAGLPGGSSFFATGKWIIGDATNGTVVVQNRSSAKADGDMIIGLQDDSVGNLTIQDWGTDMTAEMTNSVEGMFIIGYYGEGNVNVKFGASLTSDLPIYIKRLTDGEGSLTVGLSDPDPYGNPVPATVVAPEIRMRGKGSKLKLETDSRLTTDLVRMDAIGGSGALSSIIVQGNNAVLSTKTLELYSGTTRIWDEGKVDVSVSTDIRGDDGLIADVTVEQNGNLTVNADLNVANQGFNHEAKLTIQQSGTVNVGANTANFGKAGSNNDVTLTIDGPGSVLDVTGGTVILQETKVDIKNGGKILATTVKKQAGTTTTGNGTIVADVTSYADSVQIIPEGATNIDTLTINGDWDSTAGVTLLTEIAGVGDYDVLDVTGAATLGGILNVTLTGFSPADGDSFDVVTVGGGLAQSFDTVNLPALSSGLSWEVVYGPNVTLNVVSNQAPVANDDFYAILHDTTLDTALGGPNVLDNDSDADGDPLTAVLETAPSNGTLTRSDSTPLNPGDSFDGDFIYTPTVFYVGADTFQYKASDGIDESASALVTIDVMNATPVAIDDFFWTMQDTPLNQPAPGVLDNDDDDDMDPLTAVLDTGPTNAASFTLYADGAFDYAPIFGFSGNDSFTYHANDLIEDSNIATVTIYVFEPLQADVVADGSQQVGIPLTNSALQPVISHAIGLWESSESVSPGSIAALHNVEFRIHDLGGPYLGGALPTVIVLDDDAAGYGWNIGASVSGMDLLTVIGHEFGHVLGFRDLHSIDHAHDIMTGTLGAGARRLPGVINSIVPLGEDFVVGVPSNGLDDVPSLFADRLIGTWQTHSFFDLQALHAKRGRRDFHKNSDDPDVTSIDATFGDGLGATHLFDVLDDALGNGMPPADHDLLLGESGQLTIDAGGKLSIAVLV